MLEPLTKCNNPIYKFAIFGILFYIQFASSNTWALTKKNNSRETIYLGLFKSQRNNSHIIMYNIIIWKLNIKFGHINQ